MPDGLVSRRALLIRATGCGLPLAAALACGRESGPPRPAVDTRLDRFTGWLAQRVPALLATHHVPGFSVALIRDGEIAWRRGFGLAAVDSARAVTDDTIFEAQSMSKPVFAYLVMLLAERGVLDLDTPLVTYPGASRLVDDPRFDRVTARHVLSHTSGVPTWRSGATPLAMQFAPGERWLYSGEAYSYLQSIVTDLIGRRLPEPCGTYEGDLRVCATDIDVLLGERVLAPFGMTSSGYVWRPAWEARAAMPHDGTGRPLPKAHPSAADAARYASAGGLHTTPSDYARFLIEAMSPTDAGATHLTRTGLTTMVTPVIALPAGDAPASSWALGWQVFPTADGPVIAHGGNGRGFHAYAGASITARSGFVAMTNGDNGWRALGELGLPKDMRGWLGFA